MPKTGILKRVGQPSTYFMRKKSIFLALAIIMTTASYADLGRSIILPKKSLKSGTHSLKNDTLNHDLLMDIYFSIDQNLFATDDSTEIAEAFENLNTSITNYVYNKIGVNLNDSFDFDDPTLYFVGLVVACNEVYHVTEDPEDSFSYYSSTERLTPAEFISCFMEGIGIIAFAQAIQNAITGTLTASTILNLIRTIGKRYLGWFALITAVYVAGDCLGV